MRIAAGLVSLAMLLLMPVSAGAEISARHSGTRIIETGQPFADYLKKLTAAVKAHKMGIVAQACATCGAKSIGITIPGNRVVMIFNPHFAVRMLKASEAAGIEAPLRLYITEKPDGTARLTYRLPSHVFAPYEAADLDDMARELDDVVSRIVDAASK